MARRGFRRQKKHDQKVRKLVKGLERKGWKKMRAQLKNYEQPKAIGKDKRIPDIEARKAGVTRLIEVETEDTMQTHKKQHEAFRRSAAQRKRTTFKLEKA